MSIMLQNGPFTPGLQQLPLELHHETSMQRSVSQTRSDSVYPYAVLQRLLGEMERRVVANSPSVHSDEAYQSVFEQVKWSPDLEVFTRGDELVLRAELDGVDVDDIQVRFDEGILSISGAQRGPEHLDPAPLGNVEEPVRFVRRLSLPEDIREQDIKARYQRGVLEISFPGA